MDSSTGGNNMIYSNDVIDTMTRKEAEESVQETTRGLELVQDLRKVYDEKEDFDKAIRRCKNQLKRLQERLDTIRRLQAS
jgi:hypothetical protein